VTSREDAPEEFRSNVYKSWQIVQTIVRQMDEEVWIVHTDPMGGGSYDCLSLCTMNQHGGRQWLLHLNRNGQNALIEGELYEGVWARCDRTSPSTVALDLLSQTYVSVQDCMLAENEVQCETADRVVQWIGANQHRDFYVGPHHWPGGPSKLLDLAQITGGGLPYDWPGPEISLAVDRVEVERLYLVQTKRLWPLQIGECISCEAKVFAEAHVGLAGTRELISQSASNSEKVTIYVSAAQQKMLARKLKDGLLLSAVIDMESLLRTYFGSRVCPMCQSKPLGK